MISPDRPRLLLVSEFTELEWAIKPLLEEWAEVMSFDVPGIGDEPLPSGVSDIRQVTRAAVAERGLGRVDSAGWDRFFVVADGWAIGSAVRIATRRRAAAVGVALGHAKLSFEREGERAPVKGEVYDAFTQLLRQDAPAFIRHGIAQVTKGGVDEEHAKKIVDRMPANFTLDGWRTLTSDDPFAQDLLGLECPILLAKHEGCLMSTDEGFEDALAALPEAQAIVVDDPPPSSPRFAAALREFCARAARERVGEGSK
jgi:hypothetical protein